MRLCDLARAIDDALFDACIMYDKTLVVGAGATYIAGSMSYDLFYCRSKSLYEGRCLAYPCGSLPLLFTQVLLDSLEDSELLLQPFCIL